MNASPQTGYERLPRALAGSVDEACDRFEQAWRAGRRPAIESYLDELPEPARSVLVHELILIESLYRRRAGETPQPDDFRSRFPVLDQIWLGQALTADAWLAGALAAAEHPTQLAGPSPTTRSDRSWPTRTAGSRKASTRWIGKTPRRYWRVTFPRTRPRVAPPQGTGAGRGTREPVSTLRWPPSTQVGRTTSRPPHLC